MSRIEKLLQKFRLKPDSLQYADIEVILLHAGCEKIGTKGSHVKCKHRLLTYDIVIPVHNGDCKGFYKKQVLKQIITLLS